MKYHTSHFARPLLSRRKILDHSNNLHKPKPLTNSGVSPPHCKEGFQIFLSTSCLLFLLDLRSDQHQNPSGSQLRKTFKGSQDPQMKQKPQIAQNTIPLAKLQPLIPIQLLFDFSLIYTVLRNPGNKGEQESPFPQKHFSPSTIPLPSTHKRTRKTPGLESARDKEPKPLNCNSAWTNCYLPLVTSIYRKRGAIVSHFE